MLSLQMFVLYPGGGLCAGLITCYRNPMVIILATGSEVCGFKPGQGRWLISDHKNPEYDFLQKGSKAMGPVL